MPIKLNGATNGSVELDVPAAVGSDLQVTLPATAGEVVVKDSSGNITTTGSATLGGDVILTEGRVKATRATSGTAGVFSGFLGSTLTSEILANGSAEFAGKAKVGNYGAPSSNPISNAFEGYNNSAVNSTYFAQNNSSNSSAKLWLGYDSADNNTSIIQSNGNATFAKVDAVFNSSSDVGLNLRNSSTGTSARFYSGSSIVGSITVTGSATAFNTSSDYRLKENVVGITDGITRVKQLSPSRFNFIADADTTVDGFLAHEAQTVVPEAVTGEKDGEEMQGIDQSKLVPLLTAALQEAIAKIETLETKVAALEATP